MARYRWMRAYYKEQHLELTLPGCVFRDRNGATVGYLEELHLYQGRLFLRGWALASGLRIRLGNTQILRRPNEERDDVASALGCDRSVGFRASLPFDHGPLVLELEHGDHSLVIKHDMKVAKVARRAERKLMLWFWRDLLPLLPMIARGLFRNDADLPRRVKVALRLGQRETHGTFLNPAFLTGSDTAEPATVLPERITIIMPVYNALDLLPEALGRVVSNSDRPFRLVVIEDDSSDPRVRPWLRNWIDEHRADSAIEMVENDRNLGFIGSVNRGLELTDADRGPVVLLNSDAMVPKGWLSRLVAPLTDPSVASATPLSNDAEIFTAPIICARNELETGQGDIMDAALFERIDGRAPVVEAPTGVGFCMAIQREWLRRVGSFDAIFGRGYGEEVDWCRRASALGGRHVAVSRLFVEHRGGASFGPEKLALIQQNNAIISSRYPGYDQMVQDFIRDDPLVTPRLVAALAWAESLSSVDQIPIFIGHSMGGGAENYLQDRVRAEKVSVVLRFGGACRCRIELDTPHGRMTANTDDLEFVLRLFTPITKRRIIYSCAVGDPDLAGLPEFLLRLSSGTKLEVLFHDYLPLSPSYTLLGRGGIYRGVPDPDNDDPAHCYKRPDGTVVTLAEWRADWGRVIASAERLRTFSTASKEIVLAAYPEATGRVMVTPHKLLQSIPALPRPRNADRVVVAVLGAIGPQKGAAVLSALSRTLKEHSGIGLVLIGRIAPGYPLSGDVPVHGAYAVEDIPHLAARYKVTHWLIPSIWPETFSYTVHECLATGLPTLAFDLGAQGDAVSRAKNGVLLAGPREGQDPDELAGTVYNALRVAKGEQIQTGLHHADRPERFGDA